MKIEEVTDFCLALPEVARLPHHKMDSFRVRGKIFVTVPPENNCIHLFVSPEDRVDAIARYPGFLEELHWGRQAVGLRATLAAAIPEVVRDLVTRAWRNKAPASLVRQLDRSDEPGT